jgi:hypothetical protein
VLLVRSGGDQHNSLGRLGPAQDRRQIASTSKSSFGKRVTRSRCRSKVVEVTAPKIPRILRLPTPAYRQILEE